MAHEVNHFADWLDTLPHKTKVVIPGNHQIQYCCYFSSPTCFFLQGKCDPQYSHFKNTTGFSPVPKTVVQEQLTGNHELSFDVRPGNTRGGYTDSKVRDQVQTTITTQHLHNIYTTFTQHSLSIYTIFTQYLHNIYTIFTQHLHNIYTIFTNIYTLVKYDLHFDCAYSILSLCLNNAVFNILFLPTYFCYFC